MKRLLGNLSYANVAATVAVILLAANLASAAQSAPSGEIVGCVNNNGGALRIAADSSQCDGQTESPLTWNQAGQQGPAGVTGTAGPSATLPKPAVSEIGLDLKTAKAKIRDLNKQRRGFDEVTEDDLQLGKAMDRMSKFMKVVSEIMKKLEESSDSIVENLK
jgi:hypothetical protein